MDEEYYHPKTIAVKRKNLDSDVYDLSLYSPSRKTRRLDVDMPPMVEGTEKKVPFVTFDDDSVPEERAFVAGNASKGGLKIEELPDTCEDNHQAVVLFNSDANASPLSQEPLSYSISIEPRILLGLKKQVSRSSKTDSWLTQVFNRAKEDGNNCNLGSGCLAIVPWVPSPNVLEHYPQIDNLEMMDADEIEGTAMEVEDGGIVQQSNVNEVGGLNISEGLPQWPKQHCMIPQPPNNGMRMTPFFGTVSF